MLYPRFLECKSKSELILIEMPSLICGFTITYYVLSLCKLENIAQCLLLIGVENSRIFYSQPVLGVVRGAYSPPVFSFT